jgi:hypothetical protein
MLSIELTLVNAGRTSHRRVNVREGILASSGPSQTLDRCRVQTGGCRMSQSAPSRTVSVRATMVFFKGWIESVINRPQTSFGAWLLVLSTWLLETLFINLCPNPAITQSITQIGCCPRVRQYRNLACSAPTAAHISTLRFLPFMHQIPQSTSQKYFSKHPNSVIGKT